MIPLLTKEETWKKLAGLGVINKTITNRIIALGKIDLTGFNLSGADFSGAYLRGATFRKADLRRAYFEKANLIEADFRGADLKGANFTEADLREANLSGLDLRGVCFSGSDLIMTNLERSNLSGVEIRRATLRGAKLTGTNLRGAYLIAAYLDKSDLRGVDLRDAILVKANLKGSNLRDVDLRGANLAEADLSGTDLRRVKLSSAELVKCSLVGADLISADLNGCKVYGASAWDVKTSKRTKMKDLVISRPKQPLIMVDDIEVAQFIYTILNNQKIKNVIDAMRTKAVLILGSFDPESNTVHRIFKETIRDHGYLPLLFDFKAPYTHELMETVKTMALLSNFVIIDLSVRSGQLHELSRLVPDTYIPFVTIARKGTKVTAMLGEFRHHYWYRDKYFPYSPEKAYKEIPELFESTILPWVEDINKRIRKRRIT